jgi:hypothetical protein
MSTFTQFRIFDAKSATPSSLITAPTGGVLNEKRCTRDKIQIHRHGAYESEIYYLPIRDEALKTEIIARLLARRTASNPDTPCLDATEEQLRTFIDGRIINVIGFVRHVRFPKDEASGSIQIGYDGAYITDLCRNYSSDRNRKTSPVKILFHIFEGIIRDKFKVFKSRLMVEIQDGSEKLEQIYSKNYGYKAVDYEVDEEGEYTIMEKELPKQKATKTQRTVSKRNTKTKSQRSGTKTRKRSE